MKPLVVVLGDQLFEGLPGLPVDAPIFMREDPGLATRVRHHKQKVVFFFAAMRHFATDLAASGRTVVYEEYPASLADGRTFGKAALACAQKLGCDQIVLYAPADRYAVLADNLHWSAGGIPVRHVRNPSFITTANDWRQHRKSGKRPFMASFYRDQRRRMNVLLEPDGTAAGGEWSYDAENRKPLPKGLTAPAPLTFPPDAVTQDVLDLVRLEFENHPGEVDGFEWPVSRADAVRALDDFVAHRLDLFGPYEDAICKDQATLWHSRLSPLINIGLLSPVEVVNAAVRSYEQGEARLASVEGFVRQVIGWREFIKKIDEEYGGRFSGTPRLLNRLGHSRKLGGAWWTGTTGLPPIDRTIQRVLNAGWCHHIERLMILGSAMLLCEVDPDDAYRWFLEMFIDSADWVMAPNVYGMSQFADGGFFATKPYISASAYLRRMSNEPAGPWCEVWDGLYWRFVSRHEDLFVGNPRSAMAVRTWQRFSADRQAELIASADAFIERVTRSAPFAR